MNARQLAGDAAVQELFDHVLRFSRAFYDAFEVSYNKVRFWRFLFLVLEKEREDESGLIKDDFSPEEIRRILGPTWTAPDIRQWRRDLVKQFSDSGGLFLDETGKEDAKQEREDLPHLRRGRPPQTKLFKLSAHFNLAATTYAKSVIIFVMRFPISHIDVDHILKEKGPDVFRQIMVVLETHYYKAWKTLLNNLASVSAAPRAAAKEFNEHAPYWAITVIAWKQYRVDPSSAFDEDDFFTEVQHVLRSVAKEELKRCLSFMTKRKVFVIDESSGGLRYALADACLPHLERYATELQNAREHLNTLLTEQLR